jgi:hypothetical protein
MNDDEKDVKARQLINEAEAKNKAFIVDWRSFLEDVVSSVSSLVPELHLKSLGEEKIGENWIEKAIIDTAPVSYPQGNTAMILSFIHDVNFHLAKKNQIILFYADSDDNLSFILLDIPYPDSFRDLDFIEP